MTKRTILPALLGALAILISHNAAALFNDPVPQLPARNDDGSIVTGIITANFDPTAGVVPFPSNLLLSGTDDLTLNIPVTDPGDFGDPQVALNALDGFSTVAPWSTGFSAPIDPASVVPGDTVRVFEVSLQQGTAIVTGVNRELQPGVDYTAVLSGVDPNNQTLAIVPLRPLQELTTVMAVITDGVSDMAGNDSTPAQTYFLAKRTEPLVDEQGNSTEPLLPNATVQALEPLRQIISSQESAAVGAGIPREEIVISWTMTTQSVSPTLGLLAGATEPTDTQFAPTGLTTGDVVPGSPGIADLFIGIIDLPYYLGVPSADNPAAPLTQFWRAEPGAFVPPFDALGLNPESDFLTVANPLPMQRDTQTVPVLMTVPNPLSGTSKPDAGWPVVIFQHGITRNRSDMLAIADTLAAQGFVVIAIDQPLHGITQTDPTDPTQPLAGLYVENTPFGPVANERTFDLDLMDNETGAMAPDGEIDPSGSFTVNLTSLLTARDNLRQASADLVVLARTLPGIDINGDQLPDLDGARIGFVGQSLGSMVGIPFLALEPSVDVALLSVPGGGVAEMLNGSQTFGPQIRAGLQQAAGIEPGTPDFQAFLGAAQTVLDSADPVNWLGGLTDTNAILLHEVIGDTVIPNAVAGAPLAGTEPLIRELGVPVISETVQDPEGVDAAVRFLPPASHGSLLDPGAAPLATAEMQGQMASLLASFGTLIQISNPDVIDSQ